MRVYTFWFSAEPAGGTVAAQPSGGPPGWGRPPDAASGRGV
jgi:hypothetical protein